MENEVKNEGQEALEDTIITTAPEVDDIVETAEPVIDAMSAIEPIPAPEPVAAVEPIPVEPAVEPAPVVEAPVEPASSPAVEEVPAVEPAPAPVVEEAPAVEPAPAPVVEAAPVAEPAPAPAVEPVKEEVKDEVKGVEVNPNTVQEPVPGASTESTVQSAPAVDLNAGNFKDKVEPESKANSLPKIIAAVVLLALIILFVFNIDKVSGFITNLSGNKGPAEEATPTPTPEVVQEETKLSCQKSTTDELGNVTQETYTYNGVNNLLKNYSYVVNVTNTVDATKLEATKNACELEKAKYIGEAGYSLICELTGQSAVKTLTVDVSAYKLYDETHASEEVTPATPQEGEAVTPTPAPAPTPNPVPAPEYGLDANMKDIKVNKESAGFTCE